LLESHSGHHIHIPVTEETVAAYYLFSGKAQGGTSRLPMPPVLIAAGSLCALERGYFTLSSPVSCYISVRLAA